LVRAHSTPQKLAERARIVLLAAAGVGIGETAQQLGIWRKTAGHWRRRRQDAAATAGVAARLSDAPRCGAPATFTPEVICQIMALACTDPETLDVLISHWSQSELARQSVARGIVKSISHGPVGRFKKEANLKSHRNRYWLTPKPDPDFDTKCADICAVYQAAPGAAEQGVQTVSIDKMTGIQELERAAPSLPMKPGHVDWREFEYIRHGTKALIAVFDVASGKIRGTIGDTRTEADFVAFLEGLFASAPPTALWVLRWSATTSTPTCPKGSPAWLQTSAASTTISGRRGSPAFSCQWRHARRSYAMSVTGSPSTLRPNMPLDLDPLFAAQADRDLVLDPGPQTAPPRQLYIQGASAAADRKLHHLLQCDHGEAVPLDDGRQAAGGVSRRNGFGCSTGCTRHLPWHWRLGLYFPHIDPKISPS
jgi:hypothetical protein